MTTDLGCLETVTPLCLLLPQRYPLNFSPLETGHPKMSTNSTLFQTPSIKHVKMYRPTFWGSKQGLHLLCNNNN